MIIINLKENSYKPFQRYKNSNIKMKSFGEVLNDINEISNNLYKKHEENLQKTNEFFANLKEGKIFEKIEDYIEDGESYSIIGSGANNESASVSNNEFTQLLRDTSDTLVVGRGVDTTVRTDCKTYKVAGEKNDNSAFSSDQLSPKERELLIYIAYHEAGIAGDPTQATAVMSAFLNGWEISNMSFGQYVYQSCAKWSAGDQFYNERYKYKNGTYTYDEVTSYKKYKDMVNNGDYDTLSNCLDNVLGGVRNVNATQWAGNHYNKDGRLVDMYHAPLNK